MSASLLAETSQQEIPSAETCVQTVVTLEGVGTETP